MKDEKKLFRSIKSLRIRDTSQSSDELIQVSNKQEDLIHCKKCKRPLPSRVFAFFSIKKSHHRSHTSKTGSDSEPICTSKKNVSFNNLCIREFDIIMGDNPSCSEGPPLSLGWEHGDDLVFDLDDYECKRKPRRTPAQMKMGSEYRWKLLQSLDEQNSSKEVSSRRMQRNVYKERRDNVYKILLERRKHKLNNFFAPPPNSEETSMCSCENENSA